MSGHIKRIIIYLIFFSSTNFGFSKGNYLFPEIGFRDISLKEINKDSTLKIIKGLIEYKRIFGIADIRDTVNHFYLSDIDNDQRSELLYYGLINAEGKWTIIWKFDRQTFHLLGELFGKINGISDSFHISTYATASIGSDFDYANLYRITDDAIDFLQSVMIFNKANNSNSLFLRSVVISDGVKIPDSLPIKKKIVINNTRCDLRAQPFVNDKPDRTNVERYGVLRGNAIAELSRGTVASATARYTDDAGRVWWFVVLDNPLEATCNVYNEGRKENSLVCGWINAENLDFKDMY